MASRALAQLSYDSAVRALDLQERAVEQLRARTGTLLAASSLAASLLWLGASRQTDRMGALGTLALVSLASSVGLSVYVLLPRRGLAFSLSAPAIYERLFGIDDEEELHKRLVYWLEVYWQRNQRQIKGLDRCYFYATIALLFELVFWSWTLLDLL
jgi:hypothetical protein